MKVAIIGHRNIEESQALNDRLMKTITDLIVKEGADTFLFGSKGQFNGLCYDAVSELRRIYDVSRVYVRAEYCYIDQRYENYLLTYYEDTFYSAKVHPGPLAYIERNQVLVDMCDVVLTYYDVNYTLPDGKTSGTKTAIEYAIRKNKLVINLFEG